MPAPPDYSALELWDYIREVGILVNEISKMLYWLHSDSFPVPVGIDYEEPLSEDEAQRRLSVAMVKLDVLLNREFTVPEEFIGPVDDDPPPY